jgi:ribonucleotide reductase beta subunit family protein with ferritin-like domain
MALFEKRVHLKPYEYPDLLKFRDAIRHSYWLHTEFSLSGDVQDWYARTEPHEAQRAQKHHARYLPNRSLGEDLLGADL